MRTKYTYFTTMRSVLSYFIQIRTEHKIQHSISILSSYHILFGLINFFPCQVVKTPRAKSK